MSVVAQRPQFPLRQAEAIAAEQFGWVGKAVELDGERDQNLCLTRADGSRAVLKIANPAESQAVLELQHAGLARLHAAGIDRVPQVMTARHGGTLGRVDGAAGPSLVCMVSWVGGRPLARVRPHASELLADLGGLLAQIDRAWLGFVAPAADRHFAWHPDQALVAIGERRTDIPAGPRREWIDRVCERFVERVVPRQGGLRRSLIHNDANDHNVLVTVAPAGESRIGGLIDFGDLVKSALVADPAVACAYVMLDKRDPLAVAAALVAGYHRELPLSDDELAVLFEFALLRLALSGSMAARQRREAPGNAYLSVSEEAVWRTLPRLLDIHPRAAEYELRAACGKPPCPGGVALLKWLDRHAGTAALILPIDLSRAVTHTIDLGVDAPELAGDVVVASRQVSRALEDAGAEVGVGRYDEVRACYLGDGYAVAGDRRDERRTVHLGIDLFVPAGTAIHAPLDGEVLSLQDNAGELDYGPTVMLRHTPIDGPEFFTLYGHLARGCLAELHVGQGIARGARFAAVGAPPDNGGWPPHVHFQLIADRLDRSGDFPGVAAPERRALWLSLCPDPSALLGLPVAARAPRGPGVDELLGTRRRHLGANLSLAYRRPLKIVRGRGTWLFDADGQPFLDTVNNVCHVGHAHPSVVAAAARQMGVLNTNTRYLHPHLGDYAARLLAHFEPPLEVCFFVCSGSEANELALRLARAATGHRDVICLRAGYHGNTAGLVEVSPYKHDGPGGGGAPAHVHSVPLPDPYRGIHRLGDGGGDDLGARYAAHVADTARRLVAEGRPPAAFLAESIASCGGQIVFPPGYLAASYAAVRAAGGVCIADEVQVGFGRVGSRFWGFELQGVVPDIVTLGKPIGNGHPLGAVVTTRAIADAFANGMEYFNTFGGNPVSCAVGLAVLDVIEAEGLQRRAQEVGEHLLAGLRGLMHRHRLIGDVRGHGLFLGCELVADRDSRRPAPAEAAWLVNRLRDRGVLMSTDGPDQNVLKIKPPLAFAVADADFLLAQIDEVLGEDALRGGT